MENSEVKVSGKMYFDSRIDYRITNPIYRATMQLSLNRRYSTHRGD